MRPWPALSSSTRTYSTSASSRAVFPLALASDARDDPQLQPPAWDDLIPHKLTNGAAISQQSHSGESSKKRRTAWLDPKPSSLHNTGPRTHTNRGWAQKRTSSDQQRAGLPPANDPNNISPFLPLVTRERNHLLAQLRQALHSRRPARTRMKSRRGTRPGDPSSPWDPDQVWAALARVLKYPEDVPTLPHSQFPSSTRTPAVLSADPSAHSLRDAGFFTSSRTADEEHALPEGDDLGRTKIPLSLPELRRAFTVFASSTPRTRNGLNRLLVVAELIAQKRGGDRPRAMLSPYHRDDGGMESDSHRLQGGGAGLRDKDWAALVSFVGANLRTARADPEVKSALALFSQRLEGRPPSSQAAQARANPLSPSRARPTDERMLYNSLLHVVGRAKMWELFEQILQRMHDDAGLEPDAATFVELIKRDDKRGAPVSSAWALFERGLARSTTGGQDETGAGALWNAIVSALGRRGMLPQAVELYEAMKAGKEVDVTQFRPVRDGSLDSPVALMATPPPPDDRVFTSLIQAHAYRGELAGAIRILHDVLGASGTRPAVHHFTSIFRAFVQHGQGRRGTAGFDRATLGGAHIRSHALRRDASALSALVSPSLRSPAPRKSEAEANPFTLAALSTLFESFLALAPPPRTIRADLPFLGARTAPSPKDMFWILFAFDRLSGGDSRIVLEVWTACERKFATSRSGWTGWRMDKRVARMVETHRAVVVEHERRLRELE